jgi:hypothetical protein
MSTAICHTSGCENEGVPIDVGNLTVEDPWGGPPMTAAVSCGPCGQPITDVTDGDPDPAPPEIDNTLPGVEAA